MSINPLKATEEIKRNYLNYLRTIFPIQDPLLRAQFVHALEEPERFVKGPLLEVTPPFKTGATLKQLISEGVLSKEFQLAGLWDLDLPLYRHQETAIRKVVVEKRNIIVATGTGSGKTETFLMPIFDYLMKQKEAGLLGPGIRALLLYPMNALANDQLDRLRKMLQDYRDITFGRYTGETEREHKKAIEKHRRYYGSEPLKNELISREQMWQSPPHLLLTNYAMVEYLLLRPQDSVFFDGPYAQAWRFLVLDEAHTYTGAKGIEIAMLIRRLKERVGAFGLHSIGTSATLGQEKESYPAIVQFAQQLFGEPFEWDANNIHQQDVVIADRLIIKESSKPWGTPSSNLYHAWHEVIGLSESRILPSLIMAGKENGVPASILRQAETTLQGNPEDWRRFIFEVLKSDLRLILLQELLSEGPTDLVDLAPRLFPELDKPELPLILLIDLARQARAGENNQVLLPARYHLFTRAVEGAYLGLMPEKKLYLDRYEFIYIGGTNYPVFEIATCNNCGAIHLVGKTVSEEGVDRLEHAEPGSKFEYYWLASADSLADQDEDEEVEIEIADTQLEYFSLCGACGSLERSNTMFFACSCPGDQRYKVIKASANEQNQRVNRCLACGKSSPRGMLFRFSVGNEAAGSVISTALYQQISPRKTRVELSQEETFLNDDWGDIDANQGRETGKWLRDKERRLLVFSDSRQDAAFFAPYLQRTYSQILHRCLIVKVLQEQRDRVLSNAWRVQDLINPLQTKAQQLGLFLGMSLQEQKAEVWRWVLNEFLALDRYHCLEGLGVLGYRLVQPASWVAPRPLKEAFGLTDDETWVLYQVLLDSVRMKGALVFPEEVSPKDEFFAPRNREIYIRGNCSVPKKGILSWSPSPGRLNTRLDYLLRLAARSNNPVSEQQCRELLARIWDRALIPESINHWRDYFLQDFLTGEGSVTRLSCKYWELVPSVITVTIPWYKCDKCRSLTLHNLKGVCPNWRCEGQLQPCFPGEVLADNHYRQIYLNLAPIPLKAEEHTAQLTSRAAADLQVKFNNGEVNVLSCSTTFELGVDVGQLEAVFMRNVPPTAANYIQRAGRAGRRTESTAFAVTFAQKRSHDLTHYREPWRMVAGKVKAPYFEIKNLKVVRRHIYATALSCFWRQPENQKYYGSIQDFCFKTPSGPDAFLEFLGRFPTHLQQSLNNIVPLNMKEALGLDSWGWVSGLFDDEVGVLTRAYEDVTRDVRELEEVLELRYQQRKPVNHLMRLIDTIKKRNIINFLSSHNVIPKYGFPVDVVELQLMHHGEDARRLELDRDLRIALSEYAPSSQVIAGGKLWTSRYIKRPPQKEWDRYRYAICKKCNNFCRKRVELDENNEFNRCPSCNEAFSTKGTFINPAFGFVSEEMPKKPGETKPERTYSTRVFFSGEATEGESTSLTMGKNIRLVATPAGQGKLAVINSGQGNAFKVCMRCGYTKLTREKAESPHDSPWGGKCSGTLENRLSLGHEFETDIIKLNFEGNIDQPPGFWLSLMYALLEGVSEELQIERQDLDGCLYPLAGNLTGPAIVLFDDVPGGAGHVGRVANPNTIVAVLRAALKRMETCRCGGSEGNTSCYECLRNYRNQFCHKELKRGPVIEFLRKVLLAL